MSYLTVAKKGVKQTMRKKAFLSIILALTLVSGCAMVQAEVISDHDKQVSIFRRTSNCNTEETALAIAADDVAKVFGIDKDSLQGEASYNYDSKIQPDGWFVQMQDENWDYAVWIEEGTDRVKIARASEEHPMISISNEEMKQIVQSEQLLDSAKDIVMNKLGDSREVKDVYFDNLNEVSEYNSVDIMLILEDGNMYMLSFYKDGMLRSLLYS